MRSVCKDVCGLKSFEKHVFCTSKTLKIIDFHAKLMIFHWFPDQNLAHWNRSQPTCLPRVQTSKYKYNWSRCGSLCFQSAPKAPRKFSGLRTFSVGFYTAMCPPPVPRGGVFILWIHTVYREACLYCDFILYCDLPLTVSGERVFCAAQQISVWRPPNKSQTEFWKILQ